MAALTVHQRFRRRFSIWLLAAVLLGTPALSSAQDKTDDASPNTGDASPNTDDASPNTGDASPKTGDASPAIDPVEAYVQARIAFHNETEVYWQSIGEKRGVRIAKRRNGEQIVLGDYVLEQPPVYSGPPRPPGYVPRPSLKRSPASFPTVPEFLAAAERQYNFVPDRPKSEAEFQQAYAKVATEAGLTREQAVRIYAFETGGNGEYDTQAGLTSNRNAKPISTAIGYNQLLSANSVNLLAGHGDKFLAALNSAAAGLVAADREAMDRKIEALQKMIAVSRSVPNSWNAHGKLARTDGGKGIHAATLDRDIGPLLQTQKLLELGCLRQGARLTRAARCGRTRADELHRRRQRLRHGDHAAGTARQGADLESLPARRLRGQPARAAHRHGRGAVSVDRRQDGPRLAIAGRQGAGGGVFGPVVQPINGPCPWKRCLGQNRGRRGRSWGARQL